jgi:hypothetical protein
MLAALEQGARKVAGDIHGCDLQGMQMFAEGQAVDVAPERQVDEGAVRATTLCQAQRGLRARRRHFDDAPQALD